MICRYDDNGMIAIKGTLQVPLRIIKRHKFIYYKYGVVTRQRNGLQFEHIWNVSSKKWNGCRCLDILASRKKQGGLCIIILLCMHSHIRMKPRRYKRLIGASLSEPHIDWHNGPRGGECIYQSVTG